MLKEKKISLSSLKPLKPKGGGLKLLNESMTCM